MAEYSFIQRNDKFCLFILGTVITLHAIGCIQWEQRLDASII